MSWESINVNDITVSPDDQKTSFEPIPNGTYTLQLMGAEDNRWRPGQTSVSFAVADESSEFRGRRVFLDIPDPTKVNWAPEVFARIVNALGASVSPYSNPIEELNRLSQNGHSRLTADVYIETYFKNADDKTKEPTGKKNKIRYKSLRAAA